MRESLLKMKKSRQNNKKKLKLCGIMLLKSALSSLILRGNSTEIFNFDFFLSRFLPVLLPFDYDNYDHKRFKSPQKQQTLRKENKCNKIIINITLAFCCCLRDNVAEVSIEKTFKKYKTDCTGCCKDYNWLWVVKVYLLHHWCHNKSQWKIFCCMDEFILRWAVGE